MAEKRPEFVFFDCFDVLIEHGRILRDELRRFGQTPEYYSQKMGAVALAADRGDITFAQYQGSFNAQITGDPGYEIIPRLKPINEMQLLVRAMRGYKKPHGLLTNAGEGAIDIAVQHGLLPRFEDQSVIQSWEVGAAKPDPAIFEFASDVALYGYGVGRDGILLVDDNPANVEAAQDFGWQATQFDIQQPCNEARRIGAMVEVPTHHFMSVA